MVCLNPSKSKTVEHEHGEATSSLDRRFRSPAYEAIELKLYLKDASFDKIKERLIFQKGITSLFFIHHYR